MIEGTLEASDAVLKTWRRYAAPKGIVLQIAVLWLERLATGQAVGTGFSSRCLFK